MPSTINFPNMFEYSSGKVSVVTGADSDKQSMKGVLLTSEGALLGDPTFGCAMKSLLFEIRTGALKYLVAEKIQAAIERWVPQVKVNAVDININEEDKTTTCVINYYTINTGETNWLTLTALGDQSVIIR